MFHNEMALATIAKARQHDLFESANRYHVGPASLGLMSRVRHNAGMALIAAGERLADHRDGRSVGAPAAGAASTVGTGNAA